MLFYLAPMEGITGYIVRNAYAHYFPYIDKYFTPFIPAAKKMSKKINPTGSFTTIPLRVRAVLVSNL
mgnify:CR=1 FL=1